MGSSTPTKKQREYVCSICSMKCYAHIINRGLYSPARQHKAGRDNHFWYLNCVRYDHFIGIEPDIPVVSSNLAGIVENSFVASEELVLK